MRHCNKLPIILQFSWGKEITQPALLPRVNLAFSLTALSVAGQGESKDDLVVKALEWGTGGLGLVSNSATNFLRDLRQVISVTFLKVT